MIRFTRYFIVAQQYQKPYNTDQTPSIVLICSSIILIIPYSLFYKNIEIHRGSLFFVLLKLSTNVFLVFLITSLTVRDIISIRGIDILSILSILAFFFFLSSV